MFLLGYDIGSSSVKVALVDARSGNTIQVKLVSLATNEPQCGKMDSLERGLLLKGP